MNKLDQETNFRLPPVIENETNNSIFFQLAWFSLFENKITSCQQPVWFSDLAADKAAEYIIFPAQECYKGGTHQLQSMSNYYSPYFDLLSDKKLSSKFFEKFFQDIKFHITKYDAINIYPCTVDTIQNFSNALKQLGFHTHIYTQTTNWYHPNITSLSDFWDKRPSRLKSTIQRKKEKTIATGQYHIEIFHQGSKAQLISYLIDYHHCYRNSWKNTEPNPAFIDAVAELAWQQGKLRLGIMYHKNIPVAGQIWFCEGMSANIFKLAHDKNYTKHSVGTLLTAELVNYVISQDNISYLDFLTGDDDYKKDWMTHKRPLYGLQASNLSTMRGVCGAIKNQLSEIKKTIFKNK